MRLRGKPKRDNYNPPLFPSEMWSVSERLIQDLPRTTNTAESWHRKINRIISPHPGLHKFIQQLQKVQNETEVTVQMLVCGRPTKKTKKVNIESNLRLKSIHARLISNKNYDK
ncbi:uncharacterized protein LOC132927316 [Rhopalosiphum padi]|uniref:uncharacterized protein LOC132927316 n=1 Tax=Rhopalosiphum padi TaxID=40932 RepID=UPI00298DE801|nr:uncharacterized protein LOC132927316 [Rhopalosiphum padi]